MICTGSFSSEAVVYDIRQKDPINIIKGHHAELSNCIWNFSYDLIATSSLDGTAKIWDIRDFKRPLFTFKHRDEVLDVCFDYTGKIATCSSDCTAKVYNSMGKAMMTLEGHTDEISKICFSPNGCLLLTASADKTARLWHANGKITDNNDDENCSGGGGVDGGGDDDNGLCLQVLTGHESELFSCSFNYNGDALLTAGKDNKCKLYR